MVAQLARFAGALRACGFRVGLSEEIDAAAALALVDLLDRSEVHRTLRIALRLPRDAWETFDRLFEEYWDGRRAPHHPALDQAMKRDRGPAQWRWDGQRVRLARNRMAPGLDPLHLPVLTGPLRRSAHHVAGRAGGHHPPRRPDPAYHRPPTPG